MSCAANTVVCSKQFASRYHILKLSHSAIPSRRQEGSLLHISTFSNYHIVKSNIAAPVLPCAYRKSACRFRNFCYTRPRHYETLIRPPVHLPKRHPAYYRQKRALQPESDPQHQIRAGQRRTSGLNRPGILHLHGPSV